jgi:hypothetical protein
MIVCYALTSDGQDEYALMTAVSAALVRDVHPDVRILVLVDEETAVALDERPSPLSRFVDDVIRVETGLDPPGARNRFVKTSIRSYVDGPFLYLDADTLALRPFADLFATAADIGVVFNRDRASPAVYFPDWVSTIYEELGWVRPLERYFNAGVVFYGDTEANQRFAREYHEKWRLFHEPTVDFHDQPAFNSAIESSGIRVRSLPISYNAMVEIAPCFVRGARILHYFVKDGRPREGTLLEHLIRVLEKNDEIDWAAVQLARSSASAWTDARYLWNQRWKTPARQYLEWGKTAWRQRDREAAWRYLAERCRRRPLSPATWGLALRVLWTADWK